MGYSLMIDLRTSLELDLPNQSATETLGVQLSTVVNSGDIIFLHGTLGIGKSVLARAFIRAYCKTNEDIPSPTFTVVQTYDMGPVPVFHFDFYRLETADEVLELGIEEAFSTGISLIEWPELLGESTPSDRLEIQIMPGNNETSRKTRLTGFGYWKEKDFKNVGIRNKYV